MGYDGMGREKKLTREKRNGSGGLKARISAAEERISR